jgi:hypothetical protein
MQLTKFTVSGWFRSNNKDITENSVSSQFIVAKGGVGQDSSGNKLNYGIWMSAAGMLNAGFETSNGTDVFIGSHEHITIINGITALQPMMAHRLDCMLTEFESQINQQGVGLLITQ